MNNAQKRELRKLLNVLYWGLLPFTPFFWVGMIVLTYFIDTGEPWRAAKWGAVIMGIGLLPLAYCLLFYRNPYYGTPWVKGMVVAFLTVANGAVCGSCHQGLTGERAVMVKWVIGATVLSLGLWLMVHIIYSLTKET